ncbi:ribulose-phosphate 3-epimerase [Blattabacterium punctulatus]|uniref:Ribulose-phosphate 3-epimerase n=1 Tax=Blattabacterium punctulatus TaxID=164514 RepID=A0ABN5M2A1_9FLAO|nr:ribulose-phosphate 3-epimerase [Blattabacterium punctulatus]AWU39867.1 ribulose-phosphate 3-epimerase [Blattabacterium punctulatus]AWU40412.1 ribulose-phosphate 3-epimerase [Blattabacterium punctulatus]AWU42665.1 ribulose-phosphate 3-epimerase [Blattabacterium punctulatus]AWU43211.1 ribulose-phosphate 3-epimerase [Blattabacterium punctulatus]AWU44867.1 ribulose-phosphate 3-epimerase [Blattabacterium punctulatus]
MKKIISPSLLSADLAFLYRDIEMLNKSEADWFHIDIMDSSFVSNISFGTLFIKHVKKYTHKPIDVHLMIMHPEHYIEEFKFCGADNLHVHYEACIHLNRTIYSIKEYGMKVGVAVNPHTPVFLLKDVIKDIDFVLLMSVNPGFSGQKFIHQTYQKLEDTKDLILKKHSSALIEVDGGINLEIASLLFKNGADILVAGTTIFSNSNPKKIIHRMKLENI